METDDPNARQTPRDPPTGSAGEARRPTAVPDDPTVVRGEPAVGDAATIGKTFGPYRLLGEIGHGGMGVVWKALDTRLDRTVAIKGILTSYRGADARQVERFLREARAAAKLRHPNIVSVHEVGEIEGQRFLVCDYIEGEGLDKRMERGLSAREAATLVRCVAQALQYAHDQGIVHRDVKPSNILIDKADTPYVADFGLAKDVRDSKGEALTVSGDILGTPAYMSPEQARGRMREVGPASDQFSLGVVLYEALAERKPFEGESPWAMLLAVETREPVRPSALRGSVHRDLETICMKALEKDPSRRYARMGDLAEDLRRFLDGEPILARPVGVIARSWRSVRRYPVVSALVVTTVAAAVAAGTVWWRAAAREEEARRERDVTARRSLEQLRRIGDVTVEAALAWRAKGEVKRSRELFGKVEQPVQELIALDDRLAEPFYYRGRMLRAVGREEEAVRAQDDAVKRASAPDAAEGSRSVLLDALYERGVLRAGAYVRALEDRRLDLLQARAAGHDPFGLAPPNPGTNEVEEEYAELVGLRQAAARDLRSVVERLGPAARSEARLEASRGLAAMLSDGSAEAAKEHLSRAIQIDPYLQEVYTALAELARRKQDWEEAASWYAKGHEADRGYIPHLVGTSDRTMDALRGARRRGLRGEDLLGRALAALEEAARMDPDRGDIWCSIAVVRWTEGQGLAERGQDPEQAYRRAQEAAERAVRIDAADAGAVNDMGIVCKARGDWLGRCGKDPTEPYAQAVAWYGKALLLRPAFAQAAQNLGEAHRSEAEWRAGHGANPEEAHAQALAGFEKALSIHPRFPEAANGQGIVCKMQGDWLRSQGGDPSEAYARAVASFERALALRPNYPEAASGLGLAHESLGDWLQDQGKDPTEAYARSVAQYDHALALNPAYARAASNMAQAHCRLGKWKAAHGADPNEDYDRALAACEKALSILPEFAEASTNQANAWKLRGDWLAARGKDPTEAYAKARAAGERALSLNPALAPAANDLGNACLALGSWLRARGKDPSEAFAAALEAYGRALSIKPGDASAANNLACVHKAQGDWLFDRGKDPSEAYARSVEACEKALSINARCAEAANNQGLALHGQGDWLRNLGKDPTEPYARGLAAYGRALTINPAFAEAANNRARLHLILGDWLATQGRDPTDSYKEAVAGFDAALSIRPEYAAAENNRANALLSQGNWLAARGGDAAGLYGDALAGVDRLLSRSPALWQAHATRGLVLERLGRTEEAIASYEGALRTCPGQRWVTSLLAGAHYRVACVRARASVGKDGADVDAAVSARLREEAFRHLRQTIELGCSDTKHLAEDADLAPLHDDPRWGELLKLIAPK